MPFVKAHAENAPKLGFFSRGGRFFILFNSIDGAYFAKRDVLRLLYSVLFYSLYQ